MPSFSKKSQERLDTCDASIMRLFYRIIENYDCTIISGYRSPEEQFELFKIGRKEVNGKWIRDGKKKIVTKRDGFIKSSDHNCYPSKAVDVAPYPIDWDDEKRFKEFAAYVKGHAANMNIPILWAGDWKTFPELIHWYIK